MSPLLRNGHLHRVFVCKHVGDVVENNSVMVHIAQAKKEGRICKHYVKRNVPERKRDRKLSDIAKKVSESETHRSLVFKYVKDDC